ncbi:bifunctional riboflavin kinase / FMN adenylyltransferase [Campylobacter iguaniorum]|uniref:Riboflavin biosynthesis protein n=1 Tax=Campylobacter iguaniorum TaxID=1244531 RepID=A0A076FGQ5_9BACT|nr:bifunctional riboflavin kinase/FAD synthetase [Campylobacter iguaniorum]AII14989.1 bifunctional riboflavin kinase / FMN adenylyltransferase [Campylobacter iguaniorum]ALV24817.1 bifunctional riboflavin kinase / FMN adenylyltransferase [Campylobacter iguaniorum]ANE36123.1 bifunctional riboflavin kinase / FMN adenylyltransferase [Campylobacter iguaniorum]
MKSSTTTQKNEIEAIAIGHFDGIHKGHKELIKKLGNNGALVVIDSSKACITPGDRREEYAGVPCFYYNLKDISELRGDEFLELLTGEFPNLKRIVVGYDFKFGKDRAWDKHDLKNLFCGEVVFVDEFSFDGLGVHSSAIRRFIRDGDIYRVNRLLGREYSIKGKVVEGQGIGKDKIYPTLNLVVDPYLLPKDGVYATRTKIGDVTYSSITFIGCRLSTDAKFSVESHILDAKLSGKFDDVRVCFIERIRDNIKFDSLELLKEQITKDMLIARNVAKVCDLSLKDDFIHSRDIL